MENKTDGTWKPEWWCVDLGQAVMYTPLQLGALAESFFRFTPDVVLGKNRLFLEMSRTKKLFNLDSIQKRAAILAEREGLSARFWQWGVGKTLPEAWVQTRWKSNRAELLPMDCLFDYIDPLFHTELNRSQQERIALFQALGMRKLHDLFQVPHDALLVRFGEMLDQFSKNYFEPHRFPWVRFKPQIDLIEVSRWNADEWVIDAESLIFRVKPLVDRMMSRLFALRQSLKKLEVTLKLDSNSEDRMIELQFAFPQTSSQFLLKLLRERLSAEMQKEPLTDAIVEVSLQVREAVKRDTRSLKFSFSEQDENVSEDLREKWMELISYLGTAFQMETSEHILPERSWKKVLTSLGPTGGEAGRPLGGTEGAGRPLGGTEGAGRPLGGTEGANPSPAHLFQKRPLKLYSNPVTLSRSGMFLKKENELWRICEFSCEEKLSGYEWDVEDTTGFDRTYYRVKVASPQNSLQQTWWIYKDEILNRLMLHGVYA